MWSQQRNVLGVNKDAKLQKYCVFRCGLSAPFTCNKSAKQSAERDINIKYFIYKFLCRTERRKMHREAIKDEKTSANQSVKGNQCTLYS
jgi:hypothetical protein